MQAASAANTGFKFSVPIMGATTEAAVIIATDPDP